MTQEILKALMLGVALLPAYDAQADTDERRPQGLEVTLTAMDNGTAPCRIGRRARYDQSNGPLYFIRGEGEYSTLDGQFTNMPLQIQYRAVDGIVEDSGVTMPELPAPCNQLTIEWRIEQCENQDRELVQCPNIELLGESAFREVNVLFAY